MFTHCTDSFNFVLNSCYSCEKWSILLKKQFGALQHGTITSDTTTSRPTIYVAYVVYHGEYFFLSVLVPPPLRAYYSLSSGVSFNIGIYLGTSNYMIPAIGS